MMVALIGGGALGFSQLIEMQREIGEFRSHMTREIGDLRLEMREEIGALRLEVREEIAGLSERVARIETVLADRLPPRSIEAEEP